VKPSKYLIIGFNTTFLRISWNNDTDYEINKIIKSLKTEYSFGYYEIPIQILKFSAPFYHFPLNYICNKFLPQVCLLKD